jgi:hypothetical protein
MEDRKEFLRSRLETKENIYRGYFKPLEEHLEQIFNPIFNSFVPAENTKEILDFVSRKDINVCRDKTIVIFMEHLKFEELNAFKYHLYMNFVANWRTYIDFVSKVRLGGTENLKYSSITLDRYYNLSFTDNKEEISKIQNVDILFIQASKYIYEGRDGFNKKYYYELLKNLIDSRGIAGLVTIVFFLGNEKDFKYVEERLFGIQYKKEFFNIKNIKEFNKTKPVKEIEIDDCEVYD